MIQICNLIITNRWNDLEDHEGDAATCRDIYGGESDKL